MSTREFCLLSFCWLVASFGSIVYGEFPGHGGDQIPPEFQDVSFGQGLARMEGADQVQVLSTVFKPVWETKTVQYQVTVKVPVMKEDPTTKTQETYYEERTETCERSIRVMHLVAETSVRELDLANGAFFELNGIPADKTTLRDRLKQQTLVVVTHGLPKVPYQFQVLFKPGTLVIAIPPGVAGPIVGPAPVLFAPPESKAQFEPQRRDQNGPFVFVTQPAPPAKQPDTPDQLNDFTLPNSLPPTFRMAAINEQGFFALTVPVAEDRSVTGYKIATKIVKDERGAFKNVSETMQVELHQQFRASFTTLIPRQFVTGQTVEGNAMLDAPHISTLKQREIPVVVSRDGKPVDPAWLQNIKPKMLVLVPPTTSPPAARGVQAPVEAQPALPNNPVP